MKIASPALNAISESIAAVIPVYNKESFVARAIDSVLAQGRPVDEIIVVNDASTDHSLERVLEFKDARIKLLQRTEAGPGGYAARNLAIRHATSRWIAFLDADDTWRDDFIEQIDQLIAQASDRIGCVFTGYENIWPGGLVERDRYSLRHKKEQYTVLNFEGFISAWLDIHGCPILTSASAFRRDVLLQAGLFPEQRCSRGGDKDLWLRALALADALSSPRICATYYRQTENQVTQSGTTNVRHCLCGTLEKMIHSSSGARRMLFMRLFNHEVFDYARSAGQSERVSPAIYRGFFVSLNPLRYLVLVALTYLPVSLQKVVRQIWLGFSTVVQRRQLETRVCTHSKH
jgi:succinoglycan biosynthesis protein ExoO